MRYPVELIPSNVQAIFGPKRVTSRRKQKFIRLTKPEFGKFSAHFEKSFVLKSDF
jgi:hypothetical protein